MIKDTILEYHKQLVDMGYKTRFQVSNARKCVYIVACARVAVRTINTYKESG